MTGLTFFLLYERDTGHDGSRLPSHANAQTIRDALGWRDCSGK